MVISEEHPTVKVLKDRRKFFIRKSASAKKKISFFFDKIQYLENEMAVNQMLIDKLESEIKTLGGTIEEDAPDESETKEQLPDQ